MQQSHAEVRGQFAQLARVLVHPLVGIDSHLTTGVGEPERAAWFHPIPQQILDQSLAQSDLDGLHEPALANVQKKVEKSQDEEDAELEYEVMQVAPRQRVVEGFVPSIEENLAVGREEHDHDDGHDQDNQRRPDRRHKNGAHHRAELARKPRLFGGVYFSHQCCMARRRAATHEISAA